jgi:hypothetical protein
MPIDTTRTAITIALPFTVDVSGLNAELFGTAMTLEGFPITVTTPIVNSAIYDLANAKGWINYIQLENEDTFRGYINNGMATSFINAIKGSLHISDGTTYNVARKGVNNITTTGAWPGITDTPANQFHNLQDFVLAYFAHEMLGHPNALSIIANDPVIRTQATQKFNKEIEKLRGLPGLTFNTKPTNSQILAGELDAQGVSNGLTANDIQAVIQQVMAQDPARLNVDSKGVLQPVVFLPGDKLQLQLVLRNNKYKLFYNNPSLHLLNYTSRVAASAATPNDLSTYDIGDRTFVLEFVVGQ